MNEKLDTHSASLVDIESKIDVYADSYKQNQRKIEKLDKAMDLVEEDLGLERPDEYKIQYSTSELV